MHWQSIAADFEMVSANRWQAAPCRVAGVISNPMELQLMNQPIARQSSNWALLYSITAFK